MSKALSRLFESFRAEKPQDPPPVDIGQLEENIRRLQEKHEAACEERRRWLVGTVLLAHAQSQPELNEYLYALLDHFLEDRDDRRLFGLDRPEPKPNTGPFGRCKLR